MDTDNSLRKVMLQMRERLAPKFGEREAAAMTRAIFHHIKGWDSVQIAIRQDEQLSNFIIDKAQQAVDRLMQDEPLQYIFGRAPFYGMEFDVTKATLIPRPETSALVDMIVDNNRNRSDLRVLDLGTGTGCIAIALARNLKFASVTATDISTDALAVAAKNSRDLKANVRFLRDDMLSSSIDSEFDLIVSNPPYIAQSEAAEMEANVLLHEPHSALFVPDDDPLRFYSAIAKIATRCLRRGGELYLEINPRFSNELRDFLSASGFGEVTIIRDIEGRERFIYARFQP